MTELVNEVTTTHNNVQKKISKIRSEEIELTREIDKYLDLITGSRERFKSALFERQALERLL